MYTPTVINGNSADVLKTLDDSSIDLVVTSPPYDNLRDYNGYTVDIDTIIKQLYRVVKDQGIVVWVVGDATISGGETITSFKQAMKFVEVGFKLHDTMIYEKNSSTFPARRTSNRYTQIFEYMFVFSKGDVTANLICDKPNKEAGKKYGKRVGWGGKDYTVPEFSPRTNIWRFITSLESSKKHPAIFPYELAHDHIISWSREGDVVLDPFAGSGTTLIASMNLNRKSIGIEISQEYCDVITSEVDKLESMLLAK